MDATSIKSSMGQQVRLLNQIDELMQHCKKNNLISDVAEEDVRALTTYVETMRKACDVVNLLADKASKDKQKTVEKTTNSKAVKPMKKIQAAPETDDLDFLD